MKTEQKTASHTPGPWELDEQECMVFLPVRNAEGKRYAVACATDELKPTAGYYSTFEAGSHIEPRANMRLIAAAPELLSALEQTLSAYLDARLVAHGKDWSESNPVIAAARAAIAKAKGE